MAAATACFMRRRMLLIFCVTALLFRRGQGTSSTPEEQHLFCGDGKYEVGSPYAANVGWLLPNLTGDVIRDGTIYQWKNASKWGSYADVVGSTAMCYADHSPEDCAQCLRYGTAQFDEHISEYMTASSPVTATAMATAPATATSPATATATAPAMAPTTPSRSHQGPSRRVMVVAIIGSCSIVFLAGIILLLGCLFRARTFRTLATQPRRKIIRLGSFSPKQFSVNQLRTATENFSHPLGSGAFGTVYKGTMGGTEVAVKKLHNKDGVGETAFDREACILMAFKHKNLVKLLGYCNKGKHRFLCFEYLSGGSLDKLIYGMNRAFNNLNQT